MTSSAWEPGLDRHEWEGEFQTLEPELRDSPRDALPELADLVERMLLERGIDVRDRVALEGDERSFVVEYLAAREISDRVERDDETIGPGDVGGAVQALRELYEFIVDERRSP